MNYLLIWDIDGTLIQGRGMGRRAMDSAFLELYGIKDGFKDISMAGRLDSVILADAFALHSLDGNNPEIFFNKYCFYLEKEVQMLARPIIASGIWALLEKLEQIPEVFNVLGTGNIEKGARVKLGVHALNPIFPTGGFGDEFMERWQVIEKAASNARDYFGINFTKENTFVIGDTPMDIECGKKNHMKTIGVATGGNSVEELKKCGADYVFKNLEDSNSFLGILK